MASIKHQEKLERLYSNNQLIPRIKREFEEAGFAAEFEQADIPVKFGMSLLVQISLHKRCDVPTMVGIMYNHATNAQECADLLFKCLDIGVIGWDQKYSNFVVVFDITPDVQAELDKFQFPLPMVVEPLQVKCNTDTGYLTSRSSIICKDNHTEDDVCLDHINRVNKIKLCIDNETATLVSNQWRNLDKVKEGETIQDLKKRIKAFNKYNASAREVMDLLLIEGNEFYMTHKYDKRGRVYSQGYHVNPQGNAWNKAVINFANGEITE